MRNYKWWTSKSCIHSFVFLFFKALKPLLQKTKAFSVRIPGEHHMVFSSPVFCSLLSVPLHLSASASASARLPPWNIFRALLCFFIRVGKDGEGGDMNKKKGWDEEGMRYCTEAMSLAESTENWTRGRGLELLQESIDLYLVFVPQCLFFIYLFFFSTSSFVNVFFFACKAGAHFNLCFTSTAPHEICKDEHLLSMSWKRASAGETVYNKCPTNATG